VDTSAVLELVEEKESSAAAKYLSSAVCQGDKFVASMHVYLVAAVDAGLNVFSLAAGSDLPKPRNSLRKRRPAVSAGCPEPL
jgi:hypothetical protein